MLRPLPMSRLGVLVRTSQATALTRMLAGARAVQIEPPPPDFHLAPVAGRPTIARYEALVRDLEQLVRDLQIPLPSANSPFEEDVDPERDLASIEQQVEAITAQVREVRSELADIRDQEGKVLGRIENVLLLQPLTLPLETLRGMQRVLLRIGVLRDVNIRRAVASLGALPHVMLRLPGPATGWDLIVLFASPAARELVDPVLASANFKPLEIPGDLTGLASEAAKTLWERLRELEAREHDAVSRLRELVATDAEGVRTLLRKARAARRILEAQQAFGRSERLAYVNGWVPKEVAPALTTAISRELGPATYMEVKDAAPDDPSVPVLLKNPSIFRPFEAVVTTYSLPSPREIDPTPIVAVTYLLMFGAMFGDVGQGLLLVLAGFLAARAWPSFRDIARIIGMCGVAAVIFGFLYGSVFGVERELLPEALAFPLVAHHTDVVMGNLVVLGAATVAFGVVLLSLGIIFNIVNSIVAREWVRAVLDPYGIIGLAFYWSALAWAALTLGGLATGVARVLVIVLGVALAILVLREPIARAIERKDRIFEAGIGFFIIEAVIDLMDTVVRFLSNTVSFVRIAAFGLTHAGIFMAVHVLGIMASGHEGGLGYWIAFIIGNVFVMVLEVLIVSIQCLRLQYYEIFGKFFRGGGTRFAPLVAAEE